MTIELKFNPDHDVYAWEISNTAKISEFAESLPTEQSWLKQSLKSFVNEDINGSGIKAGSISEISYDSESGKIKIGFTDTYHGTCKGRTSFFEGTIEDLRPYSLKANGISQPTLDDDLAKEFPKFALIRQVAKENPDQIKYHTNWGLIEHVAITDKDGAIMLEKASLNELPLNETEKGMVNYLKKLKDIYKQVNNCHIYKISDQLENMEKPGFLARKLTSSGKAYSELECLDKELRAGYRRLTSAFIGQTDKINNEIFHAKSKASFIESFDPSEAEKLIADAKKYLERADEVVRKYNIE